MREEEGWGEMRERKERIDLQRERERVSERERKTLGRKVISIYICVCVWKGEVVRGGRWFPRARLKGGDHINSSFYFRMDDNNVDVCVCVCVCVFVCLFVCLFSIGVTRQCVSYWIAI